MIIAASALGVLNARADSLEGEFRKLCAENGAEVQEMPAEMTGMPAEELEAFMVAQVTPEAVAKAAESARTIPEENLWLTVSDPETNLTMYGEELEGDKVGFMILLDGGGECMFIYMRGDKDLANHIQMN